MEKLRAFYKKHSRKLSVMVCMAVMLCMCLAVSASATSTGGLDNVGTVADFLWEEIGSVVTTIVSTPLLLIPVGIFVAGAAIGLAKRFIGR